MRSHLLPVLFAWLAITNSAQAASIVFQKDGVAVRAFVLSDRVVFCFSAEPTVKIASDYGINFRVPDNEKEAWSEALPKLVTKEGWYFALPLRVELKTRGAISARHVSLDLGACYAEKYCNPIALDIEITSSPAMNTATCPQEH